MESWLTAWQRALYGEAGFYRRPEGPAAHFATSAQGIPGVGAILAQTVLALADEADADVIVDFACGRGELLEQIAAFDACRRLVGVDVVERPAGLPSAVAWVRSPGGPQLPQLEFDGERVLVIAHEWLDVVPCVVAEVNDAGQLVVVLVDADGTESLGTPLSEAEAAWARQWWPTSMPSERVEIGLTRDEAWAALVAEVSRTAAPGSVIISVDYAHTRDRRPPFGTLTGFRDGTEAVAIPDGSCDITAHVAVDSLDVDEIRTQREVMLDLFGDAALQPPPIDLATSNPPAYLDRLATRSAFATAISPDGLGEFAWFFKRL